MPPTAPSMVPVTIAGIIETPDNEESDSVRTPHHYMLLAETGGGRKLYIGVGRAEAIALAFTIQRTEIPRPMTYQFMAAVLEASGGQLREVRVTNLTDGVFYAQAVLASGPVVDARPSDAINLAAATGAPVYVAAELLDLGTGPGQAS
jgi:uncharacterized protein